MARIFVYDGREFSDPDPNLTVDEVHRHLMNFYPELYNAESKESKQGDDDIIEFSLLPYDAAVHNAARELVAQVASELNQAQSPESPSLSTPEVIDAHLADKSDAGAAEGYLSVQRRKLMHFARRYPELPLLPDVIREYLRLFRTDVVSTRRDQWMALSMIYEFAAKTYGIPNPMLEIDRPHFKRKPGKRLSRDQAREFIAAIKSDLEWMLVTLYFGLRFRRIEAERLLSEHLKSDYIIVNGKERIEELPLLPIFRDLLLKQHNHGPGGRHLSMKGDTMAYHIEQVGNRAGIGVVTPHMLRNTAGRLWLTYGGDDRSNRQLLRHSVQSMTDHYSTLSLDELMIMEERFNPMLNLMRELGLAPGTDYQNITGGRAESMPSFTPSWLTSLRTSGTAAGLWLMPLALANR